LDTPQQPARAKPGTRRSESSERGPVDWLNLTFLATVHLLAAGGLVLYLTLQSVTLSAAAIGLVGTALTVFAISAGYHRLFSHQTYATGPVFRGILLALGAAAFQTSALTWARSHRRHHRYVDTDQDPYNAQRGFWYSHVGWTLEHTPERAHGISVADLESDPLVRWQHRFAIPIGAIVGLALPALIGWLLGDAWGGLLFGGLLRLVVTYHLTFSINSLVHMFGTQPYSERNSSRDSLLAALLTMGEGYHNYHHTFPVDYRNGARRHQYDPTKWLLFCFEKLGLAWNLKRTPPYVILRARLKQDRRNMPERNIPAAWREPLERVHQGLHGTLTEWQTLSLRRASAYERYSVRKLRRATLRAIDAQLGELRHTFCRNYREWRLLIRQVEAGCGALSTAAPAHAGAGQRATLEAK
jgi:stearoyl-CoA desaturase (delta-9 desaturase)